MHIIWPNNQQPNFTTHYGAQQRPLTLAATGTDPNTGITITGETSSLATGEKAHVNVIDLKINEGNLEIVRDAADPKTLTDEIQSAAWEVLENSVLQFASGANGEKLCVKPDPAKPVPVYQKTDFPLVALSEDYDLNEVNITSEPQGPWTRLGNLKWSFVGEKTQKPFNVTLTHVEKSGKFQLLIERPDYQSMQRQSNVDTKSKADLQVQKDAAEAEQDKDRAKTLQSQIDHLSTVIEKLRRDISDNDDDYGALEKPTYTLRLPNGIAFMSFKIAG